MISAAMDTKTDNVLNKEVNGNFIFDIPLDFEPDEGGLGNQIFRKMKKNINLIAQYISETGEKETYDEVLKRSVRTAIHLQNKNMTKDDVIFICSNNHKNSMVPFIASLFLAIPVASLDPFLSILDISHLMKEVRPKIVFVIPESLKTIEASLTEAGVEAEIVVFGNSNKYTEFSTYLEPCKDELTFIPKPVDNLDDTAIILFSSGTTGLPKGMMLSHYSWQRQIHILLKNKHIGLVNLSYATLYWVSSICFLLASIEVGGARVLCLKFDPKELWYLLDRYKITCLFLSGIQATAVTKAGRPKGIDTSNFWSCLIGGTPFSGERLIELRSLLPNSFIFQTYGMSEIAGGVTSFNTTSKQELLLLKSYPESVGLPTTGITCKVVDPETEQICGPHQHGELRIKSRFLLNGYYNRDSSDCFDSEGWLRTGDILYYDNNGCFYFVGRIKEMFKFNSLHVAPAMLEQIIMTHPKVAQVVVIGIPHEEDGDHPMAIVIPNGKLNKNIVEAEIKTFVDDKVPDRMKLRGGVKIVDSLPVTPTGKFKRREIKDMALKGEL